ncbi:MAG: hypothetical protein CO108_22120 [Deltaproteobacteria bacterium CG_4_9_14_3_um_filter_63_12]|nr:MAG: hypothetical protein CO108_22120 [Deltaproteobacteria bacterium CG_4_9_14_3_um_filter_63_12]
MPATSVHARIVCVGNRLFDGDQVGPKVYDRLLAGGIEPGIELVDGGTAGLRLLRSFDDVQRVVIVDTVVGFGAPGSLHWLSAASVAELAAPQDGHSGGVPYLIAAHLLVNGPGRAKIEVLGVEQGASDWQVQAACKAVIEKVRGAANAERPAGSARNAPIPI